MSAETDNRWNSEEQLAKNAAEWEAWKEWKKKCSVLGCSKENRRILSLVVFEAFKRKLACVSRTIYDGWLKSGRLSSDDENSKLVDFVHEFDTGIEIKKKEGVLAQMRLEKGEEPRREETLTTASPKSKNRVRITPKDYKAQAFNMALQQPDDPLRAMRGQLVGDLGIINAIVEHYLLYVCGLSLDWIVEPETGKRSIGFTSKSFDVIEEKRQEKEISEAKKQEEYPDDDEEAGCGNNDPDPLDTFVTPLSADTDSEALCEFKAELQKACEPRQMAIILAHLKGLPISSEVLQKFYGARHSAVDKAFHSLVEMGKDPKTGKKVTKGIPIFAALQKQFSGRLDFQDRDVYRAILSTFRECIMKEPGGKEFLNAIDAFMASR